MEILRDLPNINKLKELDVLKDYKERFENSYFTNTIRTELDNYRNSILEGKITSVCEEDIVNKIIASFNKQQYSLQRVINATGTIIHTNLGRSLLSKRTVENIINITNSYCNAEYDISSRKRGDRYQAITKKLCLLTGAEDAIVVNNNAAAVLLTLTSLVTNSSAIISRGELIEIGGSFRIPEIMKYSNTTLQEVGTTNRTHIEDYENAVTSDTKAILKVHTSNYKVVGFTSSVSIDDIAKIAKNHNLISIEDIGSGSLLNLKKHCNIEEPTIYDSIKKGIDIVTFSGDKLLGGVQAGFIVGKKEFISKIRKNNLLRVLRVDKITLAAIEATLGEYSDEKEAVKNIPTLRMMSEELNDVKKRAQLLFDGLDSIDSIYEFELKESSAVIGGGSLPTETVPSYMIVVNSSCAAKTLFGMLHENDIPIISRIENDKVVLDVKTLINDDINIIIDFFKNMEVI